MVGIVQKNKVSLLNENNLIIAHSNSIINMLDY